MSGDTVKLVALVVDQVKVTSVPGVIVVASAVNVIVGGAALTVMVTVYVAVPPAPVAVAVNVVSWLTVTCWDPVTARAPLEIAGVIVTDVALVADQVSVTLPPAFTLVVSAENVSVGAAGGGGLFPPPEEPPPQADSNRSSQGTRSDES